MPETIQTSAEATNNGDSAVFYRSEVRVETKSGGVKLIYLPQESEPVPMGMHGPIAAHYKVPEGSYTPRASTIDYVIGAAAGCLTGTLNRALLVRKIATDNGRFESRAVGEIEIEDGVLVIRCIRMHILLRAEESQREAAERVIATYAMACPVYRSLYKAIDITTEINFQPISA